MDHDPYTHLADRFVAHYGTLHRGRTGERDGSIVLGAHPSREDDMTRFVVDRGAALHMAAEDLEVAAEHELLAPTLLRSQVLSALHEAVHRGELSEEAAQERLAYIGRLKIRLLGDAVLRELAWKLADQLGWASTYDAEYLALTELQADAFITLDPDLAASAEGVTTVAPIEALR